MADDTCPMCGGPFGPFSGPHDCNQHLIAALRAQLADRDEEVAKLREAASTLLASIDDHGGGDWPTVIALRAALKGEG